MLFQRPITPGRETELTQFWNMAGAGGANGFVLGPTAIVVAIQDDPPVINDRIALSFRPIVELEADPVSILPILVERLYPKIKKRLSAEQIDTLLDFEQEPFGQPLPNIQHDYVYEFALQMAQMTANPRRFQRENNISDSQFQEIIVSMESLCRPALVVDGQHRLWGAANAEKEVMLPVVGIPHCNSIDQIYNSWS